MSRITSHLNEYLGLINKERLVLYKLLKHIGKYEYGISYEEHIKTRKHIEKKMELFKETPLLRQMHCISMKHNGRLRQIDAFFKAETEFDKIYNQIEDCAITHNFPHMTFYLPNSKVIGGGLVLEEWFDFLLKEHEGPQISLMTLLKAFLKAFLKGNANQRIKYTHRLFDVIGSNVRKIIEREIRGKINKQYDKIKITIEGLQHYTAKKTAENRQQDSKIEKLVHISTSPDTKWIDIEMLFTDVVKETIDISIKGKNPFKIAYWDISLRNKQSKKPLKAWGALIQFATSENNEIPSKKISFYYIAKLREVLCHHFGISDDPIPHLDKEGVYKTLFRIKDKSHTEEHGESIQRTENVECAGCEELIKKPDHYNLDDEGNYICDKCREASHDRLSKENTYNNYPDKDEYN